MTLKHLTIGERVAARHRIAALPEPTIREADVEPRLIDLANLGNGDCRYPYGSPGNYKFCANPSVPGKPYCQPHHDLCYLPTDQFASENCL